MGRKLTSFGKCVTLSVTLCVAYGCRISSLSECWLLPVSLGAPRREGEARNTRQWHTADTPTPFELLAQTSATCATLAQANHVVAQTNHMIATCVTSLNVGASSSPPNVL